MADEQCINPPSDPQPRYCRMCGGPLESFRVSNHCPACTRKKRGDNRKISQTEWDEFKFSIKFPWMPDELRGPRIWSYRRISHQRSADSGAGMEAEERTIAPCVELLLQKYAGMEYGGEFTDEVVSATKHKLFSRPGGHELFRSLRAGDRIVISKIDRGFRNTQDALDSVEQLDRMGVTLHIAWEQIDLSTPNGRLFFTFGAAMAQWEAETISQRIREAWAVRKSKGYVGGGKTPMGYMRAGPPGHRRNVPLPPKEMAEFRSLAKKIVLLRDSDAVAWTWERITLYVNHDIPDPAKRIGTVTKTRRMYFWELEAQQKEIEHAHKIHSASA
jgi:DNA invertase Pin-like site-specific DNA recombinase